MVEVCSVVERERSPINASAPVLKIPIARPEIVSNVRKNANVSPIAKSADAVAKSEAEQDRLLASEAIGQETEEDARERDRRHRGVVKRPRRGQAERELADHLRNDHADRVGGHGEHREHREGESAQRRAARFSAGSGWVRDVHGAPSGGFYGWIRASAGSSANWCPS